MNRTIDVVIPVYRPDVKFEQLLYRLKKQKTLVRNIILMHTEDGVDLNWAVEKYNNVRVMNVAPEEFDHGGTRDK